MSDNKKRMDKDTKGCLAVIIALFVILYGGAAIESRMYENKLKQKAECKEQRRLDFAKYVIEDTKNWVAQNQDTARINQAVKEYKANPIEYNAKIATLIADSTKYADSVFSNARAINFMEDTISFQDALLYVDSQQPIHSVTKTKTVYNLEHGGFGEFVVVAEDVSDGTVIEPNRTFAWFLKNNKKHLRDISLELKHLRVGKRR